METLYHNGINIEKYILIPKDYRFIEIGYKGIPRGAKEYFKTVIEGLEDTKNTISLGKYVLGTDEIYVQEEPVIEEYYSRVGHGSSFDYSLSIMNNWDSTTTSMWKKFRYDSSLEYFPMVDTSNVTEMAACFMECTKLKSIPKLNTSKVTNMNGCFEGCISLPTIPLIDTSEVTTMINCFRGCSNLTTIPLLDTSNVISMDDCFAYCTSLTTIPELDLNNAISLMACFWGCTSLTTISLKNTNTVGSFNGTFSGCTSLISIPELNTKNANTLWQCFRNCTSLTTLPEELNLENVIEMHECFEGCTNLTTIPKLNTWKVTRMDSCFRNCTSLTTIPEFYAYRLNDVSLLFENCISLTETPLLPTESVTSSTDFYHIFNGCTSLRRIGGISFYGLRDRLLEPNVLFGDTPNNSIRYMLIKDIGTMEECISIDLSYATVWGINSNEVLDARQSLIDSLLTYSFDRKSYGYEDCTIILSGVTWSNIYWSERNDIKSKGYNIISV